MLRRLTPIPHPHAPALVCYVRRKKRACLIACVLYVLGSESLSGVSAAPCSCIPGVRINTRKSQKNLPTVADLIEARNKKKEIESHENELARSCACP